MSEPKDVVVRRVPGIKINCDHQVFARQILNDDGKYYAECMICGFYTEVGAK